MVTHIAQNLGLLDNALISYIDTERLYIDFKYFYQAHMLKKRDDGHLVMMYLGYIIEIPLPNQNINLYTMNSFTFDL